MQPSHFDRTVLRIVEGVTIGVVVAAILLGKDWLVDHRHRQDEIAHIRHLIVSARSDVAESQPVDNVMELRPEGWIRRPYSKEDMQRRVWGKFIAKLSDVLEHRTSRLTYDEKRELRQHFPGMVLTS